MKDYYKILGVSEGCSKEELSRKYKELAKKYHPDVSKEPDAKERFQEINEAYETLSDDEKREKYEFQRKYGDESGGFGGWRSSFRNMDRNDFDDMMWGEMGRRNVRRPPTQPKFTVERGADITLSTTISFLDSVYGLKGRLVASNMDVLETCGACHGVGTRGGDESLFVKCPHCGGSGLFQRWFGPVLQQTTCPQCGGRGWVVESDSDICPDCRGAGLVAKPKRLEINIPPGTEGGTILRLKGAGHAGLHGGPHGDAYVRVNVMSHELFHYSMYSTNVVTTVKIDPVTAILGGSVEVLTPHGYATMTIPPGTKAGSTFRIRGEGVRFDGWHHDGRTPTDLMVVVEIDIPSGKTLSDKDRKALEKARNGIADNCSNAKNYVSDAKRVYETEVSKHTSQKT